MGSQESFNPFDKSKLMYYEKAPHEEDGTRQISSVEDISIDLAEDLAFIISGAEKGPAHPTTSDIHIIDSQEGCRDAWMQEKANSHLYEDNNQSVMIGNITQPSTVLSSPGMRHVGLRGDVCYYSSFDRNKIIFDIYYKIMGDRYPSHGEGYVELRQSYEMVHFRYNILNGRAAYLLASDKQEYQQYVKPLKQQVFSVNGSTHPFAIHFVLLAQVINNQGSENDKSLRRLMMLEEKHLRGDSRVTFDPPDETKYQLQVLHGLLLHLVLSNNKNKKYLSFIKNIMRDLDRILELQKSVPGAHKVDEYSHQRLVEGFTTLGDYCQNRESRLLSRQQRVQSLVDLTYQLLANRDSKVNLDIASEARQDGAAMRTIAVLGMVFLPATFVSTVLGSNLFALEDHGAGKHTFVVSDLWWVYLVAAIPLTLVTFAIWVLCMRRRKSRFELR